MLPETPAATPHQGCFVVFEGGEGAGKSTQARMLAKTLRAAGHEVVETREPGGTPAAEAMRTVLLGPEFVGLGDRAEALLFAASRSDHVRAVIAPALQRGAVVVCDRYIDSSLAYQGIARDLGIADVRAINRWATAGLVPDVTVVLDVNPETGLRRAGAPDRLESEPLEFHRRVAQAFLELAAEAPDRYLVLDAARKPAELAAAIASRIETELRGRGAK